jgi:ribosomal protein L7/L12
MNKYDLSAAEQLVYQTIRDAMGSLPTASQYNVLRFTAHMMDRELVRPGAVRAAAAVAGSTAQTRVNAQGARDAKVPQVVKKKKGMSPLFLATKEAKHLIALRDSIKQSFDDPPTEEQRRALREASARLRCAHDSFRDIHEGSTA